MQLFTRTQELHTLKADRPGHSRPDQSSCGLTGSHCSGKIKSCFRQARRWRMRPPSSYTILGQYGVEALATLEVAGCMLGGKVHGSLAGARKVRGQTSKVAKQEKKTGWAKRRMQYNRGSVNLVPSFGKKKGPNANS